jgi:DNA-binding NarL/FixJ family response regulator
MKVVIVDDHVLIARALAAIIESFGTYQILYECANGKELQERLSEGGAIPDMVLVDVNMPIMDGRDTTLWLKINYPEIRVLCLSMMDDEGSLLKMIDAGVNGFVLKNCTPSELENAIEGVVVTGSFFPTWATRLMVSSLRKRSVSQEVNMPLITRREMEFLKLCATELSYKEIADRMNCGVRTVETYRDALMKKLDVKGRVGLAMYALRHGIGV